MNPRSVLLAFNASISCRQLQNVIQRNFADLTVSCDRAETRLVLVVLVHMRIARLMGLLNSLLKDSSHVVGQHFRILVHFGTFGIFGVFPDPLVLSLLPTDTRWLRENGWREGRVATFAGRASRSWQTVEFNGLVIIKLLVSNNSLC